MEDKVLVSVTVITDDSTGCYTVGELDFRVPGTTGDWLEADPSRRDKLSAWLEWLAEKCRTNQSPFHKVGG